MFRSLIKFILQVAILIFVVRVLVKYTTLDDKIIAFFRANSSLNQPATPGTTGTYVPPVIVSQHRDCRTPWGETLQDGTYIIAYESTDSCNFEKRYCDDGQLRGSFSANHCSSPIAGSMSNSAPTATVTTVNTVTYGYVEGVSVHNADYDGPDRAPSSNLRVITSWNDEKRNPLSESMNDSTYNGVKPWTYTNYDLTQKGCTTPWGSHIDHADRVIAYASSKPARPGASCTYERRTCFQGRLGGSYVYSKCAGADNNNIYNNNGGDNYRWPTSQPIYPSQVITPNYSCITPWGTRIANGDSVLAYKASYVSNGYSCQGQYRTCNHGRLSGSYQYKSCTEQQSNGGCHGGSCGNTSHDCHDDDSCGGTTHPTYSSCALPRGGSISHGQQIEAYQNPVAPCYKQIRSCNNGKLSGSFGYSSCTPGTTTPPSAVDTYGSWSPAGQYEGNIDSQDSCNNNATVSYVCGTASTHSCTDYQKLSCASFSPMICDYQKRSVSCVK